MRPTSLPESTDETDPVLRLVLERALAGSRPGERSDGARLALAIEGGGMAGTVSAGMCMALEALGLIDSFDAIYGSSAGAMNASYTAAGQAIERGELYVLAARHGVIDPRRALLGRPPFRLAELFDTLFREHPHDARVLEDVPELKLTAACVETKQLHVLTGFETLDELRTAVRASAAIPVLAGDVVELRGNRYVDGGLLESLPYGAALRDGATHVLVLRSRDASHRKRRMGRASCRLLDVLLRGAPETVAELVRERPARYNAEADAIEIPRRAELPGHVTQIAPAAEAAPIGKLESRPRHLRQGLATGARAVYRAVDLVAQRTDGVAGHNRFATRFAGASY